MLETLSPTTSYANPALPKFIDPHLEALQQNLIQREQSGEFAPPTFDLKKTLSAEINLSNNELNYNGFRDFTLGKNKLINEAINEYTDILSVLDNYSVSTPDQQITGGWKEKIGQKFGDFKKAVTQNNIVKFTKRGIQTVGQVAQNSINDVRKGIVGSATVNAFGGSEKVVKSGFGYNSFYADTTEHVGKSVEHLEGKINSQIQQKWSNISPEDQKIIQKIISKIAKTTNDFRQNLINAQGKTVTNYYGAKEEKLQTKGRLTTTGAITLASAAFGPLGYAAIAGRTIVNASIGEVKGLSEQTLKSQRENLEKGLVLEDLQNITLLLDNLGNQKISLATAEIIRENFKKLNNKFLLTGQMEAEYLKIEAKLSPDLHPENFVPEGQEILQNSQNTNNLLSQFSNKLDATTAKVLGQEFIKTVESEFNDPKKRMLRIGMVVGASVAGLAFSAYIGRPALQGLYKTIFQHGETVTLPTQSGNIRLQSSHAPLDGYKVLSQQGDLLVVGKEGQTLPTDDEMRLAINKHFEQAPTIEGAKVSDFRTPDGKILEGVRTVAGKIDGKTGILIADQNNPVVSYDDTEIRFDKGTSGSGLNLEKYQDQTVIGKYGDQLVVADKNTSPQVIAELNRIEGIEKYNTSTTSPTTPQLGQNETSPIARGFVTPQQPVVQPATTTKGELLGFNTTDLSKLDATSRGGIGKLEIYAFDKDPNSPFNQMAARLRMSPEDTKAFVAVNGLYEKDGQLYTGVELKNTLIQKIQTGEIKPQDISTPEGINRVIQSYGIKSEGGMGVGVYGGNSADLAQAKAYFADVEALNQQFAREGKLILNPNDYRETTFNPNSPTATTDEANYGKLLSDIRTRNLRTVFGRGSEWQTNANTADTKAIEVYDGTPTQARSSVLGSETTNSENIAQIRQNQPLVSNTTPQNLANQQPGSNGNGVVNGQNTNLTPGANNSTAETRNNPSPSNVRLGGSSLNSDTVTGFEYRPGANYNLVTNIFGNDGGNPTYNDTRFTLYKPWPLEGEMLTTPWGGEDQPTLRVMPNPYQANGTIKEGGLTGDSNFMNQWTQGLKDSQTSTYYDPKNQGYELIVDAQGNTSLQISKDATKPPSDLNFDVLTSDQSGNIKSNRVIVGLQDTAPVATGSGNQPNPTNIPPAGNGGTTPPAQPTARTFNVAQIPGETSDVTTAREAFNSGGIIDGLDINKDIPGTRQLWQADLMKKNIANMTGKDYFDNWNDLRNLAYSGDAKGTEFGNIITEIDKVIPSSLSSENRVKIFNEVDTLLEGLAKIDPKDPNAQTTAEGLLKDYFNLTDGILQNANVPQTQGGNWYDYPLAFMAAGLWITAGTAVGLAQGRYAIDPRLSRPGLFRAVDSDNDVPPNQSALGNFINRTYNNPLLNRFDPRRLRLETYKDAVVSIAGLFTGPFGWGLTLGTGVARYIADRNPSEEDPQRIVGNQHFR
jgi:hypothetical protein